MKKFKKVFAVLLTLAMVLGMSMTSFAADYTIKVEKLQPNTQVSYIQIVQQDADKSTGKDWELTDAAKTAKIGMTDEQLNGLTNADDYAANGTINQSLTNLDFSALSPTDSAVADANGIATITVSAPGLYAIKANTTDNVVYSWMIAYVGIDGTTTPVKVTAKGKTNQVTKNVAEGKSSVAAGEKVKYTVKVNYPYFAENLTNKSFTLTDTLTNGKFTNTAPVIANGPGLVARDGYAGTNTLIIELDMDQYNVTNAGQEVTITYEVQANEDISTTKNLTNEIKSNIKQDKDSTTDPGDETTSKVELPTFKAVVSKTNEDGSNVITDSVAKFALYEVSESGTLTTVEGSADQVRLAFVKEIPTINGVATFEGLANETDKHYYIKETQAPEGYKLDDKYYPLTGASATLVGPELVGGVMLTTYDKDTKSDYTSVGFNDGMNFHDTKLSSLPSTGGIGTTIFTIGGCAIMIIAAALFFASRRKAAK